MKTLQEMFIETAGKPLLCAGLTVIQMDVIPIYKGHVKITFDGCPDGINGVCLKPDKGYVTFSDKSKVSSVRVWHEKNFPVAVEYDVASRGGILKVWNIYRIVHPDGEITEDYWTGNAGMVVEKVSAYKRKYRCSNGLSSFNISNFIFEIEWRESVS